MFKEHDPPKEPARKKAERRWTNAEIRRRVKERQQKPRLVDPNKEPEIAGVVTNEAKLNGPIKRAETKFLRDTKKMLQCHVDKNLAAYSISLERRRYLLLKEKLSGLQAAQQNEGG